MSSNFKLTKPVDMPFITARVPGTLFWINLSDGIPPEETFNLLTQSGWFEAVTMSEWKVRLLTGDWPKLLDHGVSLLLLIK